MKNRDGLTLRDYTNFTDDVKGQIERRKLKLGVSQAFVENLLPDIEEAMRQTGLAYEHCGLGGVASGQLSVVNIEGFLHRFGIYTKHKQENGPVSLFLDTEWCGVDGADTNVSHDIELTEKTQKSDIIDFINTYLEKHKKNKILIESGQRPFHL